MRTATALSSAGRAPVAGKASKAGAAPTAARQQLAAGAAAAALLLLSPAHPAAAFGPVSVKLEDIQVARVPCGSGVGTVGGVTFSGAGSKAACLTVTATAVNPDAKKLFNADVFGRLYDSNGEAMTDDSENSRIAYIDEIAPGRSQVSFKLNVPLEQFELGPPKFVGIKATGFPGGNLAKTSGGSVRDDQAEICEILGNCEDLEAEAAIR